MKERTFGCPPHRRTGESMSKDAETKDRRRRVGGCGGAEEPLACLS